MEANAADSCAPHRFGATTCAMRWLVLLLFLLPTAAPAAERSFAVGSFERVRVDGPFEVHIVTGGSSGARVEGDQAMIEQIDIAVNGETLVVRAGANGWGERPVDAPTRVPVVTLTTPRLTTAIVIAGARVTIGQMRGQRIDISLAGAGSLDVAQVETDQLVATMIGAGALTIGGRALRSRLLLTGAGSIDAPGLTTNDLIVRVEGNGELRTTARYTAQVTSTGLGKVTVLGPAKCLVRASAGGPVVCGVKR